MLSTILVAVGSKRCDLVTGEGCAIGAGPLFFLCGIVTFTILVGCIVVLGPDLRRALVTGQYTIKSGRVLSRRAEPIRFFGVLVFWLLMLLLFVFSIWAFATLFVDAWNGKYKFW